MGDEPLSLETRARLEEAFSESDLPWKVDVLDWAQTEQGFKEAIKENSLSLTETHSTLIRNASNCMNTQYQHLSPYKLQLASLEELADNATGSIAIGPFGSRMKADCYVSSGMPVIRGTNLVHGRKWAGDWVYVPLELADTMPNCQVNAGDIVFPHRGAIGEVGIVPDDGNTYLISSSLMKIKLDRTKSEPDFIYYYFSSQAGREEILKFSSSVGTPGIGQPLTSMRQFKIPRFPLQVQKSVASILGALDDKIDLNRRTNETLEAMARALFRDWFVDFGPTRAKMAGQAPYLAPEIWELFPDKLDDEGKPEGWNNSTLDRFCERTIGGLWGEEVQSPKSSSKFICLRGVDLQNLKETGACPHAPRRWGNSAAIQKRLIQPNEFLIASSGAGPCGRSLWLGKHAQNITIETPVTFSNFVKKFTATEESIACYIEFIISNMHTSGEIQSFINGTSVPNLDDEALLKTYKIIDPGIKIIRKFFEFIVPILDAKMSKESLNLAQLRDLLLPKLMSGAIRIHDAEKMVQDAL